MWASVKSIDFSKQLYLDEIDNIKTKLENDEMYIDYILNDVQTLFKSTADNTLGKKYEYEIDILFS